MSRNACQPRGSNGWNGRSLVTNKLSAIPLPTADHPVEDAQPFRIVGCSPTGDFFKGTEAAATPAALHVHPAYADAR